MKGDVKAVGLLEGWPFPVRQEPGMVNAKPVSRARGVLRQLQEAFLGK